MHGWEGGVQVVREFVATSLSNEAGECEDRVQRELFFEGKDFKKLVPFQMVKQMSRCPSLRSWFYLAVTPARAPSLWCRVLARCRRSLTVLRAFENLRGSVGENEILG
ncbi:hypothetical protein BU15DRAFT_59214 [Melanogaster broomeanus]|nr:hypothetical protein BU15DRAFT_59214 [Melanogaster broomeanus]